MKKHWIALALLATAGAAYAQMPTPEQILAENDKDKDGVVTKEEAKGSMLAGFFDNLDANHDGKLTQEELKAAFGGAGGPPPGAPPAP